MREEIATQRVKIDQTLSALERITVLLNEQKRRQHATLGLVALSCNCNNKRSRSDDDDDDDDEPATKSAKVV